ncbi:MAG: M56 family metallopeptidase [Verrucomicrobia bacterium]|nr:M56 family metallopeptidase [Verrucomicrobiota bacterium]
MNTPVVAEFLGQLFRASWQASVLAVVVWLLILALGEHLDARWRCRLWMLVIVRLAWPVSLPSPVSLFNWVGGPPGFEPGWESEYYTPSLALLRLLESSWLQWTWGFVAAVLMARALAGVVWATWVRWNARPVDSWEAWWLLQSCKEVIRLETSVAILESSAVKSPCLLGIWSPRLVLPKGLLRELSFTELRMVFLHELAHLRRRDLVLNWLLAAVEVIHWFNPLVWFVTRRLRADREEDCDALALESEPSARRAYGEVIIKLIERVTPGLNSLPPAAAVGILGNREEDIRPLLQRIRAIKRIGSGHRTWLVGCGTWLVVALIGFTDAEPGASRDLAETTSPAHSWVSGKS